MAISTLGITVEDFKGRYYRVHAIPDCDENKGGYWCMVYRCIGTDDSPEWNRVYEEDYSTDFCVHPEDCNCEDEMEVEQYIKSMFYKEDIFHYLIYSEDYLQNEAEYSTKEKVAKILEEKFG